MWAGAYEARCCGLGLQKASTASGIVSNMTSPLMCAMPAQRRRKAWLEKFSYGLDYWQRSRRPGVETLRLRELCLPTVSFYVSAPQAAAHVPA